MHQREGAGQKNKPLVIKHSENSMKAGELVDYSTDSRT
jgi:hypothetical protein